YAYLTKGIFTSIVRRWRKKYGIKLKAVSNTGNHLVEYHFINDQDEEIKL
ncbi:MAG: hypothetical protein IM577_14980, partial [Chitinophagaceae bacterium]|nr:hypothetical protein [Chitinophagaceae bacterium]